MPRGPSSTAVTAISARRRASTRSPTVVMSREVQPAAGDERDEAQHPGDQQRRPPRVHARQPALARGRAARRGRRPLARRPGAASADGADGAASRQARSPRAPARRLLSRRGGHARPFRRSRPPSASAQASRKASTASSESGSELNAEAMLACTTPGWIAWPPSCSGAAPLFGTRPELLLARGDGVAAGREAPPPPSPSRRRPRRAARGGSGWRSRSTLRLRSAAPQRPAVGLLAEAGDALAVRAAFDDLRADVGARRAPRDRRARPARTTTARPAARLWERAILMS